MYYHVEFLITGVISYLADKNCSKEEVLMKYVCPFINKDISIIDKHIFNLNTIGRLRIFETEYEINDMWPIPKDEFITNYNGSGEKNEKNISLIYEYKNAIQEVIINEKGKDVSQDYFQDALRLLLNNEYKSNAEKFKMSLSTNRNAFMISPLGHQDLDSLYKTIIKPLMTSYNVNIERVDEIPHTEKIEDIVIDRIRKSTFVVADVTFERPNCYYEIGYAHAIGKKVIILAKQGTERHFDISTRKWNFWNDMTDLRDCLVREVEGVLQNLSLL